MDKLPLELQNHIYSYVGQHDTAKTMYDLIENCYLQDEYETNDVTNYYSDEITFYEWYFNHARNIYYECGNRYGNKLYLFNVDNYYENYLSQ